MDDLISRQAVLDKLQEHHDFYINAYGDRFDFRDLAQKDDKARVDEITTIQAFIMELPTIPQTDSVLEQIKLEQTAEWEYNSFSDKWRCNKCFQSNNEKTNYCPNCGAKMKGDTE